MKYLILSSGPALLNGADVPLLKEVKERISAGIEAGKILAAYGLVSGGVCFIIEASGNSAVARALREMHLGAKHDVQVIPLVDALALVDGHLEHRASLKN